MKTIISLLLFTMSLHACHGNPLPKETPFMIVAKLLSAEQNLEYDKALKYIDITQVYAESSDPISDWKKLLQFQYNLGKDQKFTNSFKIHNFNIEEKISGNHACVIFVDVDKNPIKEIKYTLENRNNNWIVIAIKYQK